MITNVLQTVFIRKLTVFSSMMMLYKWVHKWWLIHKQKIWLSCGMMMSLSWIFKLLQICVLFVGLRFILSSILLCKFIVFACCVSVTWKKDWNGMDNVGSSVSSECFACLVSRGNSVLCSSFCCCCDVDFNSCICLLMKSVPQVKVE